ncbi:MAG TPA: HemK/PrmC family methyltransferase [Candidatus Saccharimonadales bacterium]|nr:HemK/PrmC family methyltransferase [Candidatus Saccharimonadales bacterium]
MTVKHWLAQAAKELEQSGISTARLDCLVLLEDVTQRDRAWLLAHDDTEIESNQLAKLKKLLNIRAQHVPLAYVRGKTEFYGRNFVVSPAVLEPRPESEKMIDQLKKLFDDGLLPAKGHKKTYLADVGTGSGALGITAFKEVDNLAVELLEIDKKALGIAQINVDLLTPSISVIQSDLLSNSNQPNDVLLCNLPYVPDDFQINLAAKHEPRLAIFGGPDGLSLYRKLFKQVKNRQNRPLFILTESLPAQHKDLNAIAEQSGYTLHAAEDFIQVFRAN